MNCAAGFQPSNAVDDALQAVPPVVGPPQVGEFVQADLVDLGFGETFEQRARDQNHRIEEPDRDRNVGFVADAEPHVARTLIRAEPLRHRVAIFDRQRKRVALELFQPCQTDDQPHQRVPCKHQPKREDPERYGSGSVTCRRSGSSGAASRGTLGVCARGTVVLVALRVLSDSCAGATPDVCEAAALEKLAVVCGGAKKTSVVTTGTMSAAASVALQTV